MRQDEHLTRVPGLYRAWDLGVLIEEGHIWRIEDGGRTDDGQPLYAVYQAKVADRPARFLS